MSKLGVYLNNIESAKFGGISIKDTVRGLLSAVLLAIAGFLINWYQTGTAFSLKALVAVVVGALIGYFKSTILSQLSNSNGVPLSKEPTPEDVKAKAENVIAQVEIEKALPQVEKEVISTPVQVIVSTPPVVSTPVQIAVGTPVVIPAVDLSSELNPDGSPVTLQNFVAVGK